MKRSSRILQFYNTRVPYPEKKFYIQGEGKEIYTSIHSSCSTYPCMLQDLSKAFQDIQDIHPFQGNSTKHPDIQGSTPLQHSLIRIAYSTYWLVSTENSTEYQLNFYRHFSFQRKGDVISVRMTLLAKIELIQVSNFLSRDTNYQLNIQLFLQQFENIRVNGDIN